MTNYIDTCKDIKAKDSTNKMVAAVHEMGHYFVATYIKSTLFKVNIDSVQLLPSRSGIWYGFTRIQYTPQDLEIDPTIYNLELCKKKIRIAIAGMCAEKAMFGTYDPKGYSVDKTMVDEAISYIKSNEPDFDTDKYLKDSEALIISKLNLNTIARRAILLYLKKLNAVVQYPQDIDQPLQ